MSSAMKYLSAFVFVYKKCITVCVYELGHMHFLLSLGAHPARIAHFHWREAGADNQSMCRWGFFVNMENPCKCV